MKTYKVININTKEEHPCDKVTIDGFDYYVSDEWNNLDGWYVDMRFKTLLYPSEFISGDFIKEVIATTNPNINVPKVLDEIKEMFYKEHPLTGFISIDSRNNLKKDGFYEGYNKSQETHPFNEEDMKSFAKFCLDYDFRLLTLKDSEKELLQLWKEQKPKIVHYE